MVFMEIRRVSNVCYQMYEVDWGIINDRLCTLNT